MECLSCVITSCFTFELARETSKRSLKSRKRAISSISSGFVSPKLRSMASPCSISFCESSTIFCSSSW